MLALLSVGPTVRLSALQCPDGSPPPCRVARADAGPKPGVPPNSVAVLYFDNLSRDTADAYMADGLTEELIGRLGQVERLTVKSRFAVRRFRGTTTEDPATVGRALGVAHLVTGSIRRSGNRVRVTVELMRVAGGDREWGEQYDRTEADLLVIQEEIARRVATAVAGRLLPTERARLAVRPTRKLLPDPPRSAEPPPRDRGVRHCGTVGSETRPCARPPGRSLRAAVLSARRRRRGLAPRQSDRPRRACSTTRLQLGGCLDSAGASAGMASSQRFHRGPTGWDSRRRPRPTERRSSPRARRLAQLPRSRLRR